MKVDFKKREQVSNDYKSTHHKNITSTSVEYTYNIDTKHIRNKLKCDSDEWPQTKMIRITAERKGHVEAKRMIVEEPKGAFRWTRPQGNWKLKKYEAEPKPTAKLRSNLQVKLQAKLS